MPFEYEALVGHLYVVGGRAVSTTPPGALCEVAPLKTARGREADTFFVLVVPSGQAAPAAFYERLAALAAERYFNSSGSVTAGLRDLFQHLNQQLYDHNQANDKPYEASIICGVLRGADLIVARAGSCLAVLRQQGHTFSLPEDLSNEDALYTPPIGVRPEPDVRLAQYRVDNGTRMVFADANLADLQLEQVVNNLMAVDVATVLVGLKEIARLALSAMVVEFVPPDADPAESTTIPAAESTAVLLHNRPAPAASGAATTIPTPAAGTDPAAKPSPRQRKKEPRRPNVLDVLWRHGKRAVGRAVLGLAQVFGAFARMIDHYFGPQSDRQLKWLSSPVGLGTIVGLPVIVVGLVLLLWLSGTDESEFELCLQDVYERLELARSPAVVNSDRQRILEVWTLVLTRVEECETLRPGDAQLASVRAEGQSVTDALQSITRIEPIRIASIPQAQLTRIVAQGQNLYVLDAANDQVYGLALADDGLNVARQPYPIPEMRINGRPSGFVVGEILDIAFNVNTNRLIAVDRSGLLIQCGVSFFDCTGEQLLGVENWRSPVALTTYVSNETVYVLDSEAQNGQVWRYEESGGSYPNRPNEYFGGDARPVLRGAVDLQIDSRGNIYVLLADGTVTKHRGGQQENFSFTSFPDGQTPTSAQSFYVDDTVTSQSIYIVNQPTRTIFETSLIGNFNNSYRAFNESQFDLIADVVVITDANRREIMYVVSGNTIFALPKDT